MPIPALSKDGLLPAGIFDCSPEELQVRFGAFKGSDRRPALFVRLADLVTTMRRSGLFEALLIDGSFVTDKPVPNDVDLIAALRPGHDFERDLPMSEYALVSRAMLRRRFGFDVMVAEQGSDLYHASVEFFSRVRERPAEEGNRAPDFMNQDEAILEQTVEQLERMNLELGNLRRQLLPGQPRKFAILAEGPLEEIRRLGEQIGRLTASAVAAEPVHV